jgi:copper chaperone CopZ
MTVEFKIQGIHCQGCVSLIKLTLEDYGFRDVNVDIPSGIASVETDEANLKDAEALIGKAFKEMTRYGFSDIMEIKRKDD